jgi:hypothetical protein
MLQMVYEKKIMSHSMMWRYKFKDGFELLEDQLCI